MKKPILLFAFFFVSFSFLTAQPVEKLGPSDIDYPSFLQLSQEVDAFRNERLVDLQSFLKMAEDPEVIILDTRSESAYKNKHLKGAVHLNFSDFSEGKLAKLIPDKNSKILIYCNNNIAGDEINFARKSAPLALNIPTFINLYGYGYKNLYELSDLIPVDHKALVFEGMSLE